MNREMKRFAFDVTVWVVSLLIGMAVMAHSAMARDRSVNARNEAWDAECSSCHVAYPPRLLSAPAWRRILSGLDRHFGTDASVDARTAADIGAFLEQNAGRDRRSTGAGDETRITRTAWFLREHDELPAATWQHPAVKSAANCAACHTGAAQGDFRERNIRVPR
jgi:hypothetical protein